MGKTVRSVLKRLRVCPRTHICTNKIGRKSILAILNHFPVCFTNATWLTERRTPIGFVFSNPHPQISSQNVRISQPAMVQRCVGHLFAAAQLQLFQLVTRILFFSQNFSLKDASETAGRQLKPACVIPPSRSLYASSRDALRRVFAPSPFARSFANPRPIRSYFN
jgi:hypothetical protein